MTASLPLILANDDFDGPTCEVLRTRTSLGDRSFIVARRWSASPHMEQPLHLRNSELTLFEFHGC